MPKYINADALTAELNDMDGMIYRDLADILAAAPSADVAPVRRGKVHYLTRSIWHSKLVVEDNKIVDKGKHYDNHIAYCSICGKRMDGRFLKFCDFCGAMMEE